MEMQQTSSFTSKVRETAFAWPHVVPCSSFETLTPHSQSQSIPQRQTPPLFQLNPQNSSLAPPTTISSSSSNHNDNNNQLKPSLTKALSHSSDISEKVFLPNGLIDHQTLQMFLNYHSQSQNSPTLTKQNKRNSTSMTLQQPQKDLFDVDKLSLDIHTPSFGTPIPSSPLEPPAPSPAMVGSPASSIQYSPLDSNASSTCTSPLSTPIQTPFMDDFAGAMKSPSPPTVSWSPLSSGGFICTFPTTTPSTTGNPTPPPQCFPPITPTFSMLPPQTMLKMAPVSPAIASRQEKLEKYKQKRTKRLWTRSSDQIRRERAQSRSRDEYGQFLSEKSNSNPSTPSLHSSTASVILSDLNQVKTQLEYTQRESFELKEKLNLVLAELIYMRRRAEEASANHEQIQKELEEQQRVNKALQEENKLLWSTVPSKEIFSTLLGTNNSDYIEAFREKIDLSQIGLNWTDSPHLEAARAEENQWEKRFDEMTFIAGAINPPHSITSPNEHNNQQHSHHQQQSQS